MKTLFTILFFATISLTAFSQNNLTTEIQKTDKEFTPNAVAYRLFPTQNMWTFIKLNTRNGKMWQVQYDTKANNRHETYLNFESLVTTENEGNDRFTLYPTQNIYTFIILINLLEKHGKFNGQWKWRKELLFRLNKRLEVVQILKLLKYDQFNVIHLARVFVGVPLISPFFPPDSWR